MLLLTLLALQSASPNTFDGVEAARSLYTQCLQERLEWVDRAPDPDDAIDATFVLCRSERMAVLTEGARAIRASGQSASVSASRSAAVVADIDRDMRGQMRAALVIETMKRARAR